MLLETNTLTAPPTVPDDGPFDEHQRRFVEGFLAGLASVKRNLPTDPAAADVAGTPLTVLYGSQSGNCEALAKQVRKRARAAGFKPDVAALNDLAPADLADVRHLLILCSTFGEGDPPDNARRFHQWLLRTPPNQTPGHHLLDLRRRRSARQRQKVHRPPARRRRTQTPVAPLQRLRPGRPQLHPLLQDRPGYR